MYISPGNSRMKIPTFSLPEIKTCEGATDLCKKYCYAKKAGNWKAPKISRLNNLKESKCESFIGDSVKIIKKSKSKYIRIHEAGDFYSQEYLEKWFEICRKVPDKKFLAYTQMYDLDYSKQPKNLTIYWSVWPDTDKSKLPKKGLFAYVVDAGKDKIPKYTIRRKTHECQKNGEIGCEKCLYCYEGKGNVRFKLH